MDNFKYSLKTHQFGKKRYQIFSKQAQKQSISLQVHDPENTVSHLLQPNKSIQDSRNTQFYKQSYNLKQPQFIDQQRKTLKFTKSKITHSQSSEHLQTNSHIKKIKHITCNINTKSKINIQPQHMANSYGYRQKTQQFRQQLQVLKYVLVNNQQKLRNLVDSINLLYRNTIQLYQNHQKKLRQLVNKRCYQIASLFKTALLEIKSKGQNISQLDDRVNILINTVKDSKESLRITKIKQQCIQALQKQQQMVIQKLKKNQQTKVNKIQQHSISDKLYLKNIQNQTSLQIQQSKPKSANDKEFTNQMLEFSYFSQKNIQNNFKQISKQVGSKQFMMISCSDINLSPVTSFLQSPNLQTMNISLIDNKKSPFQANELFQISHTLPLNIDKPYSNTNQKQIQYSFRKPIPNPKLFKKPTSNYIVNQKYQNFQNNSLYEYKYAQKKPQIGQNRNYQKIKNNLKILLQNFPNNQIWIDKLNCLRRSNGTYLLDKEGNAFICAKIDYQKLIKQGIISQPKR